MRDTVSVTFVWLLLLIFSHFTLSSKKPIYNVQVTLRGEVFYVSQVTTVGELQERLQEESGLNPEEQGRVSFHGKVLDDWEECLSDVGMKDGDQINMIPKGLADQLKMMKEMGDGLLSLRRKMESKGKGLVTHEDQKEMEIMSNLYQELTKIPYVQEEMERFAQNLQNPEAWERATDPERIEELRQILLNNPLLMQYVSQSKSASDAIRDPDSWLKHVVAAVERWKTMDGYQLWQSLINGTLFGT